MLSTKKGMMKFLNIGFTSLFLLFEMGCAGNVFESLMKKETGDKTPPVIDTLTITSSCFNLNYGMKGWHAMTSKQTSLTKEEIKSFEGSSPTELIEKGHGKQTSDEYTEAQKVIIKRLKVCDAGGARINTCLAILEYLGSMMSDDKELEAAIKSQLKTSKQNCIAFVKLDSERKITPKKNL